MKIGSLDSEDGLLLAKEKFEDSETARTDPELNTVIDPVVYC